MANKKDQPEGLRRVMRSQLRDELKAEMASIEQESSKNTPIRLMSRSRTWMGIAAGVLLLIAAYFLIPSSSVSQSELVAAYFSPMKNFSVPIERGEDELTPLQEAFLAYESNKFEEAVQKFEKLPTSLEDENIGLFYAISLMEIGQYESAIRVLRPFTEGEASGIQNACNWYLSLAYLGTGEISKAKGLLNELQSESNPYQERAKEILKKI